MSMNYIEGFTPLTESPLDLDPSIPLVQPLAPLPGRDVANRKFLFEGQIAPSKKKLGKLKIPSSVKISSVIQNFDWCSLVNLEQIDLPEKGENHNGIKPLNVQSTSDRDFYQFDFKEVMIVQAHQCFHRVIQDLKYHRHVKALSNCMEVLNQRVSNLKKSPLLGYHRGRLFLCAATIFNIFVLPFKAIHILNRGICELEEIEDINVRTIVDQMNELRKDLQDHSFYLNP